MVKISKKNKMINKFLEKLKNELLLRNLDGYIVPKNDKFIIFS